MGVLGSVTDKIWVIRDHGWNSCFWMKGDISVEVIRMVTHVPPMSNKGIRDGEFG